MRGDVSELFFRRPRFSLIQRPFQDMPKGSDMGGRKISAVMVTLSPPMPSKTEGRRDGNGSGQGQP